MKAKEQITMTGKRNPYQKVLKDRPDKGHHDPHAQEWAAHDKAGYKFYEPFINKRSKYKRFKPEPIFYG